MLFYSSALNESESENSDRVPQEVAHNMYIVVRGQNQVLYPNEFSLFFSKFTGELEFARTILWAFSG